MAKKEDGAPKEEISVDLKWERSESQAGKQILDSMIQGKTLPIEDVFEEIISKIEKDSMKKRRFPNEIILARKQWEDLKSTMKKISEK